MKTSHPKSFSDFFHITYKMVSKIIANMIKDKLSAYISNERFGFLSNRQFQDAVTIARECVHSIKSQKKETLILKLDLHKAYEFVDWSIFVWCWSRLD